MLRRVAFALTLVATQRNARIDSDPILAFLCIASLHLITKKSLKILIRNICVSQINAMQGLVSHYEPALTVIYILGVHCTNKIVVTDHTVVHTSPATIEAMSEELAELSSR